MVSLSHFASWTDESILLRKTKIFQYEFASSVLKAGGIQSFGTKILFALVFHLLKQCESIPSFQKRQKQGEV